jgi:hypothetical protein
VDASDRLIDLVERCLAAEQHIDANAAIPLSLDSLFDDLGRLLRGELMDAAMTQPNAPLSPGDHTRT